MEPINLVIPLNSPESIEAIPREEIIKLRELAGTLHAATVGILATPHSPKDLEREMQVRTALNLKLSESIAYLDGEIEDLAALKKELRITKGYVVSDKDRIESRMIEGFIREKEERQKYKPRP